MIGRSGKKFDWNMLSGINIPKLYFLSGGIEPGDEERLLEFSQSPSAQKLFAIDINSRFEISAGVNNMEKIKEFVTQIKNGN